MQAERSLRTRITVAFSLLAAVLCGFFAVVVYVSFEFIEHHLFASRFGAEIEWLTAPRENAVEVPPGRRLFTQTSAPAELRE